MYYEGFYYLFYQYNFGGVVWGNFIWGYVVFIDFIYWCDFEFVLKFDEWYDNGGVWFGLVIICLDGLLLILYIGMFINYLRVLNYFLLVKSFFYY